MKRLILKVMEHGLVIAMLIGCAAVIAIGLLNPESGRGLAFLALGGAGLAVLGAIMWVRRMLTASSNTPERGSDS